MDFLQYSGGWTNVVFTKPDCPHCERARRLLDKANYRYTVIDITTLDGAVRDEFRAAYKTVPQVWLEGRHIGGADDLELLLEAF